MKFCSQCKTAYDAINFKCPICGNSALIDKDIILHAPDMAFEGGGFNPEAFKKLAGLEETNFWFRARNHLILWALHKFVPTDAKADSLGKYLEIGCGTGYVLKGVKSAFKNTQVFGSEIFTLGLEQAKNRLTDITLMQMDARRIPYQDEFDVIGAFDVLEHIDEDEIVISEVFRALKPGGVFIATVPQHDWLWSKLDDYACHKRRYKSIELQKKMKQAGFKIIKTTSFVSLLLPLMYMARNQNKDKKAEFDPVKELALPKILNQILYAIMKIEIGLLKLGVSFPFGGSRLVLAVKL